VNPTALHTLGLGLEDVRAVLASANVNRPKGQLADGRHAVALATTDQLLKAREYQPLIVAYQQGAPVRLSDVATVTDSVEDTRTAGLSDGKTAVVLVIFRQPGANIIATVDQVRALLPQLRASIPPAMNIKAVLDRTTTIRASVREVELTLLLSVTLVILVVFFFLREVRTTLIPCVAVPISLIGTFGVMYLVGYSIDNLSLVALTVATGFVVDDAIVVIENISRHLERGVSPLEAALRGAKEIGFTVVSMSVSLVAVFIPILLMRGIVGRLFREFAVTLSVAVAVSLAVSLTTTPMMCAALLRGRDQRRHGRLCRASERAFNGILRLYERTLAWVLCHQRFTMAIMLLTVGLTVCLYIVIPKGFFPQQDTGRLTGTILADQDTSFQRMQHFLAEFAQVTHDDPAVNNVIAFTGGGGGGGSAANTGRMFVALKPLAERRLSADQVIGRLRGKLAHIPGATLYLQSVQDLRVGGQASSTQYQYTLRGADLRELTQWAPKVMRKMQKLPGLVDVVSDQQDKGLEAALMIDRPTAARLGLTAQMVDNALYDAFGQRQVSTMYTPLNQYHVVLEVDPRFSQDPGGLRLVYLRPPGGRPLPISV
jgi:multidrug efflux pump subunit AcrB